jgi:hypothetical protein
MNRVDQLTAAVLCRLWPAVIAPLVPVSRRAEWLREWQAELRYVRIEAGPRAALALCRGALPDAVELRNMERVPRRRMAPVHGSAGLCLLVLALILVAGWTVALVSPAVTAERHSERYALRPDLVYLKDARAYDWEPSVRVESYRLWAASHQQFFRGLAFYGMERATVNGATVPVAHGSANLFALLGLPMEIGSAQESTQPKLVLSDALWRRNFAANPAILGQNLAFGGRQVRIAAVLPNGAWRLPGAPEAWLLESNATLPDGAKGSVLARMTPEGLEQMWHDHVLIPVVNPEGGAVDLCALSLRDRARGPWGIYLFAVLLSFLALPAVTSVSLDDETPLDAETTSRRKTLPRVFAAAKLVLILGILCVVPLDVIYSSTSGYQPGADALQLVFTFGLGIFALWWAIADQRKRCPVCLRLVTHPAHVGIASRTFLTWNGTELFCAGGHTLLEVPDMPTSWFYSPRWVYLDPSWNFLFPA